MEGRVEKHSSQLEAQSRVVLGRGVRAAVIVHHSEGALCVPKTRPALFQASVRLPPKMIAGAAGAGDAFAAGFILGLHEAWEYPECLELGVCAAAASLRDACTTKKLG